jgi:hypothetical protein
VSTPGLGNWVGNQRMARATMAPERKARLEALGWWVWDTHDEAWSTRFDELVVYHAEHGRLPVRSTQGIGSWVKTQRIGRATMSAERKARLDSLGWWAWDPYDAAWTTKFDELVVYHAEHGSIPPYATPGGLGKWVCHQRTKRATMETERKARFDALGWWVWDPHDEAWSTKFDELVVYHAEHGRFPPASTQGIGSWVSTQRQARATMETERKARLEALEWWVWSVAR